MSEKKSKKSDIAKIHEFVDSITPPPEGSTTSYVEMKQKLLQKKLFDEPTSTTPPAYQEGPTDNLPAWETVAPEPRGTETTDHDTNDEAGLPEFEPVLVDQITYSQDDDWLSSYDLLEIEVSQETNQGRQDMDQRVSEPVSFEEVPPLELEPRRHARKKTRQEQKQLRKELKQKVKRERQAYLKQEKEAQRIKRLEERERKERTSPKTQSEKNK